MRQQEIVCFLMKISLTLHLLVSGIERAICNQGKVLEVLKFETGRIKKGRKASRKNATSLVPKT
jgi:hypothetical protein